MTVDEVMAILGEGLTADQQSTIRAAIDRDSVKTKFSGVKQQSEYNALEARSRQMQAELDGDAAAGRLGAKAYAKWYDDNKDAIAKLQEDHKRYLGKYGSLDNPSSPNPQEIPVGLTKEDVEKFVDAKIQGQYGARWSDLLESTGTLVQRHMFAGRKNPIDFKSVARLANEKYGGNLETAYDEWDKPEREKIAKEDQEKEIKRRVDEELQKRGASRNFPGGADMSTPGSLAARPKAETDKFDKTALLSDLAKDWDTAGVKQ